MMEAELPSNVSRETSDALTHFSELVQKWTQRINLVSKHDAKNVWQRHILDSKQVFDIAPPAVNWLDLGSGGGFPGIVCAILSKEARPDCKFTLVDSDQRKCAFLRTAARELELGATVISTRIEDLGPTNSDVISARALSDLRTLVGYAHRHMRPGGTALFPKGITWKQEDADARRQWCYDLEAIKSNTNAGATILKIKEITRV